MVNELTAREIRMLELMAQGYRNKSIALELGLPVGTVKNLLTRLYRKFKVHNRTSALVAAHRAGCINLRTIAR